MGAALSGLLGMALAQTPAPTAPAAAPTAAPAVPAAPAGPPTDAVIRIELDRVYGKPVPEAAVCIARPALEAPFRGHVTAVGVRQGQRGCVLFGVMVDALWLDPAAALPAAVDRPAWDALPAADHSTRIRAWTEQVLLAFDRPDPATPAKVVPSARGFVVERRLLRRAERAGGITELTEKSIFDAGLIRTAATVHAHAEYTSTLVTRPEKTSGVSQALVEQALGSRGGLVRKCFTSAWEADPTLAGRVTLGWTLTAGKVDPISVVTTPGEVTNESLAKCYAAQIRAATWPPEANGTATWVFWIDRREITP